MNVLLLGNGGRENAIAWKLAQSQGLSRLFIAPGNGGTSKFGQNVNLSLKSFEEIGSFCIAEGIDMLVVGPEEPLVNGIADYFNSNQELVHIQVIGPNKAGAQLEGSKDFSKNFMLRNSIPTARHFSVNKHNFEEGCAFIDRLKPPYVLKADGLAAGKGVVILDEADEAKIELKSMLNGKFGQASEVVLIEEFLTGTELSVFVLTDGKNYVLLPEAKDYKRIGDADTGPNTGGMGAISPVPFADAGFMDKVKSRIIKPSLNGLQSLGIDYRGFIFFGLIAVNNDPYLIEYNCRLGDPETEAIIPRLNNDLLELFQCVGKQKLDGIEISISPHHSATVMLVSDGYPGDYLKGFSIQGLDSDSESLLFHAGTISNMNEVVTNGGRVLAVSSLAENLPLALLKSYNRILSINFNGMKYRTDIGKDMLNYIENNSNSNYSGRP
jgi:phosphoribosylamine--glycine ligase